MPQTVTYLNQNGIQVRELKEIINSVVWPREIFEGLLRDSYFTIASNIARIFIVFAYGGVYCDLGCEILRDIDLPLQSYQHIFSARREHNQLLEGFIGAIKYSPILSRILMSYTFLPRVSHEYMKSIDKRDYAGVGLLSSETYPPAMHFTRDSTSFLITTEDSFYKFHSLRSWIQGGKYGNKPSMCNKITSQLLLGYFGISPEQIDKDKYGALLSDYSKGNCQLVDMINLHFHGLSKQQVVAKRRFHHEKALSTYLDTVTLPLRSIPHIMHRIWLTDVDNPCEVPLTLLEQSKESLKVLGSDWRHIFWFNTQLPETIQWIRENIPNCEIKDTSEITPSMRAREIFHILYGLKRFANAGILLRYNLMNQFGGIYADMGTLLRDNIEHAIDRFDYIFSQRDYYLRENWLDVNIMASKPGAPLWTIFFHFIENLKAKKIHPDFYALKRYLPVNEDHAWVSGHALSAAIDATLTNDDAILPMSFNSLFKSGNTGSWIGKTKFGTNDVRTHIHKFVE